jgi:hypothetical protein
MQCVAARPSESSMMARSQKSSTIERPDTRLQRHPSRRTTTPLDLQEGGVHTPNYIFYCTNPADSRPLLPISRHPNHLPGPARAYCVGIAG